MENFNQENIKNENSFEQLEPFDLDALEAQSELSKEQKVEIEQAHEQKEVKSRQEVLDAFNRFEENDRESSPLEYFEAQAEGHREDVYLEDIMLHLPHMTTKRDLLLGQIWQNQLKIWKSQTLCVNLPKDLAQYLKLHLK